MNFTKEYIQECDCKEIQDIKPNLLQKGDWYSCSGIIDVSGIEQDKLNVTRWLPLSHQLDDEIVKIVDEKDYWYEVTYDANCYYLCRVGLRDSNLNDKIIAEGDDQNPLIAKIKILKQLLKEEISIE